ncbi:hypothetical protein E4634_21305, partial [Mangrovimicrobium sediminis]
VQGSAADINKKAMLGVGGWLAQDAVDAYIVMQVHDELVLEVAEDAVREVSDELCRRMAGAAELSVPLLVEAGSGVNWDEAH